MSHFTNLKTSFRNVLYLEKALMKLNIDYKKQNNQISNFNMSDLIISQLNGHDIKFCWKDQEYELVVDTSFWDQPYPLESFIDTISQQYASDVIVGEANKLGFQPVKYKQNQDGSKVIILERWNSTNDF
jgi:hypothetical protein